MKTEGKRGFTLVEILFALILVALLFYMIFNIFVSMNYAFQSQSEISDLQQNVRFTMVRVVSLIRTAGYGAPSGFSVVSGVDRTAAPDEISLVGSTGDSLSVTSGILLQDSSATINVDFIIKNGDATQGYKIQPGQKVQAIDITTGEQSGLGMSNKLLFRGTVAGFPSDTSMTITELRSSSGDVVSATNKVAVPKGVMITVFRPRSTLKMVDVNGDDVTAPPFQPRPFRLVLAYTDPDTGTTQMEVFATNIEDIQFVYYTYDPQTAQIQCYNCISDPACALSLCQDLPGFDISDPNSTTFLTTLKTVKINLVLSSKPDLKYKEAEVYPFATVSYGNRIPFKLSPGRYGRLFQSTAGLRNAELTGEKF